MNVRRFATVSALAAALAMSTSACSMDVSFGKKSATATASTEQKASAPSESAASESESTAPSEGSEATSTATSTSSATSSAGSAAGSAAPKSESIPVPADSGLQKLELLHVHGGRTSSDAYGRSVAIFTATVDRPMMITTKITILDKDGNKLRDNEGINTFYRSGTHTFIASNLVELEDWDKPAKFRVEVVDVTDGGPNFSKLSEPTVSQGELAPELTGSFTYSGEQPSGLQVSGACVLPNGNIVYGDDGLDVGPGSGTYRIPLYDVPEGTDLSSARCYVSV